MGLDPKVDWRSVDGALADNDVVLQLAAVTRPVCCNVTGGGETVEQNTEVFA